MRLSAVQCYISIFLLVFAGTVDAKTKRSAFRDVTWNGSAPSYSKGVHTFELKPGECGAKTYGDGRGESDCGGGRLRSQIRVKKLARVGQTLEYSFEFFVPKGFTYDGDRRYPAYSRLLIAEWNRNEGIKNHIYEVLLDSVRGVTFERKTCIKPGEFGRWNSFSMRIKWTAEYDGFIEARCNDGVIIRRANTQTVIPPDCGARYKLQCEPKLQIPGADIIWAIGPNFSGYGKNFKRLGKSSPFAPFPAGGVKLQVRNIRYRVAR